jgi:hypothetical protein
MQYSVGTFKLMDAVTVHNETKYSDSITFERSVGTIGSTAVLLSYTGAGTVTVTQQCSLDNSTWYDAVDASGTAVGAVAAVTTTAVTRYIKYTPVVAKFIRFKVVEGNAASVVLSLTLISQEIQ